MTDWPPVIDVATRYLHSGSGCRPCDLQMLKGVGVCKLDSDPVQWMTTGTAASQAMRELGAGALSMGALLFSRKQSSIFGERTEVNDQPELANSIQSLNSAIMKLRACIDSAWIYRVSFLMIATCKVVSEK